MKRLLRAYRELLEVFWRNSPGIVVATFASGLLTGLLGPFSVWINSQIFNVGLSVAAGETSFFHYLPYLLAFVAAAVLPIVAGSILTERYIKPKSRLILRTEYKGKMLKKLERLRYEHLEQQDSREIIEKAYARAEEASLALFPTATSQLLSAGLLSIGTLCLIGLVRWWLLLIILVPFVLETILVSRANTQVYDEMEQYWSKDKACSILGDMLRTREHIWENHLLEASDYLIHTYETRLHTRNREYEHFYLKHLRKNFKKQYLTRIAQLACAILLFFCYRKGDLSIGMLISLTTAVFTSLFAGNGLGGLAQAVRDMGQYRNAYDYYDRYFALSEEEYGEEDAISEAVTIEFQDVWFTYPGTDRPILKGLSFTAGAGEKLSIVGENGAGKSTVIKLLLGLFRPDRGSILVGGKPLECYSQEARRHMFGAVFQDFGHYAVSLGENIGIGDIDHMSDREAVERAIHRVKLEEQVSALKKGEDTLLGREFEDGVDLSGGQWQRIAIARAFMGDKPVLILDEPTSQLDPVAESRLYSEFAELSEGKTSLFITHRLGSTRITDRILVLSGGKVVQNGSHNALMAQEGIYAEMFRAQKQWYLHKNEKTEACDDLS